MAKTFDPHAVGAQTLSIHAGETPSADTGASSPDIVMSSTFVTDAPQDFSALDISDDTPWVYTRWANPTISALERKIAALEGAESCVCFASGMAAGAAILLSTLSAGDHLVISDVCYPGVAELARDTLPRFGVAVTPVNTTRLEEVKAAIRPETKLIFIETPVNPLMRVTDIAAIARLAKEAGALLAADNTFATPIGTRPLALGADFVMHSATKYLCGHGDAMGGAVAARRDLAATLRAESLIHYGGAISPFNAWLISRGAATLPIRMAAHQTGALAVAHWLETHPSVSAVYYPGLESHPQHVLAKTQMANFSGMISFRIKGDSPAAARRLAAELNIIHYAVSLGHHRSLICYLPTEDLLRTSFRLEGANAAEYRDMAGDGLFRLSVGLEDADDLIRDLDQAL